MCVYVCAHVCYFFNLIYYYYIYNFALDFFFFFCGYPPLHMHATNYFHLNVGQLTHKKYTSMR